MKETFLRNADELFCSLKQKRLCFDLEKGRFVDPHVGRNAIYDVESQLKQREVSLGGNRRKGGIILFYLGNENLKAISEVSHIAEEDMVETILQMNSLTAHI